MSERGTFKGEIKGAWRLVKGYLTPDSGTLDELIRNSGLDEEQEYRMLMDGFGSNIESFFAYFPMSREQWLQQAASLDRMDNAEEEREALGGTITSEQDAGIQARVDLEERIIDGIHSRNWLGRLLGRKADPSLSKGLLEDQQQIIDMKEQNGGYKLPDEDN